MFSHSKPVRVNEFVGTKQDPLLPMYGLWTLCYNYFEASAISKLDYFNFSERKGDTDPAVFFGGSGVYSVIFSSIDYMAGECQS